MSIRNLLTGRCAIYRRSSSGDDPVTGKGTYTFSELAADVHCRFWGFSRGSERFQGRDVSVDFMAFAFPPGQDITRVDRILYKSVFYQVTTVLPRVNKIGVEHHRTVFVLLLEGEGA